MKSIRAGILILLFFILVGCQAQESILPPPAASPLPQPSISPTAALAIEVTPLSEPSSQLTANNPPVVKYAFPTAGPVPVSQWRPPLYPVPWALTAYDHYYFVRPIAADQVNWPEADYRYGGTIAEGQTVHSGIDIEAPLKTPVLAAGSGRIIWAGYGLLKNNNDINDPYGLAVAIEHDFGYKGVRLSTVYAHMNRIDVTLGQRVEAGTQLGIIGVTGLTTGPHLHFEVRFEHGEYFTSRNPELWLAPPQGWGVLVGRLIRADGGPIYDLSVMVRNLDSNQDWVVKTYGPKNVRSDDYWGENVVLSDLPAGNYEISFEYEDKPYIVQLTIHAGDTSFFSFYQGRGISKNLPPTPSPDEWLATPTKSH